MKQNLHTHSTYCDGKDTPLEMVRFAIEKGFDSIGFSEHEHAKFTVSGQGPDRTQSYIDEINRIKKLYSGSFPIYLGIEHELLCPQPTNDFDYVIGAMHYMKIGDEYVGFDRSAPDVTSVIDRYFGGNPVEFAKKYYSDLAELMQNKNIDIIAHFDLITKNREIKDLLNVDSKEYLNLAFLTIEALKGTVPFFEINTGAMARGYRGTPYPSIPIIREFKRQGFRAVISSDCHDKTKLDFEFDLAADILRSCGFTERFVLTDLGFTEVGI